MALLCFQGWRGRDGKPRVPLGRAHRMRAHMGVSVQLIRETVHIVDAAFIPASIQRQRARSRLSRRRGGRSFGLMAQRHRGANVADDGVVLSNVSLKPVGKAIGPITRGLSQDCNGINRH